MKPFVFLCFFFAATAVATAQSDNPEARAAAEALKVKYSLSDAQATEMYRIQQRKQRDLARVAQLKDSDTALYLSKMESLQKGTLGSIRRLLNAPAQADLFQQTQTEVRNKRAEKRKEMGGQGASRESIREAMLTIYAE